MSANVDKRIGIARAILKNSDLCIFDEDTVALDTQTEQQIQQSLVAISADKTLLIITHRLSTAASCNRILVMQAGKIVQQGSHADLLQAEGLYTALWKAQHDGEQGTLDH